MQSLQLQSSGWKFSSSCVPDSLQHRASVVQRGVCKFRQLSRFCLQHLPGEPSLGWEPSPFQYLLQYWHFKQPLWTHGQH